MSRSRPQQAVDLSKQYTREQLAAAMIYGETRAGVDVKGKMSDPLAGIPELHVAQNRAKATGKDISEVLAKKKQFLGLNPASIKAVTDPDSLKGNADKAAARAAIDKAQGYFAGKYNDKVGKGTPYENVTSFNQASEAYNLKKSGAMPGSHVSAGDHNFFTTPQMDKRLQQARAAEAKAAAAAPEPSAASGQTTTDSPLAGEVEDNATPTGQLVQGSRIVKRGLGSIGIGDEVPGGDGGNSDMVLTDTGGGGGGGGGAGAGMGTGAGTGTGAGDGSGTGAGTGSGAGVGASAGVGTTNALNKALGIAKGASTSGAGQTVGLAKQIASSGATTPGASSAETVEGTPATDFQQNTGDLTISSASSAAPSAGTSGGGGGFPQTAVISPQTPAQTAAQKSSEQAPTNIEEVSDSPANKPSANEVTQPTKTEQQPVETQPVTEDKPVWEGPAQVTEEQIKEAPTVDLADNSGWSLNAKPLPTTTAINLFGKTGPIAGAVNEQLGTNFGDLPTLETRSPYEAPLNTGPVDFNPAESFGTPSLETPTTNPEQTYALPTSTFAGETGKGGGNAPIDYTGMLSGTPGQELGKSDFTGNQPTTSAVTPAVDNTGGGAIGNYSAEADMPSANAYDASGTGIGFIDSAFDNPAKFAANTAFGFVPVIGTLNSISSLLGGPNVGEFVSPSTAMSSTSTENPDGGGDAQSFGNGPPSGDYAGFGQEAALAMLGDAGGSGYDAPVTKTVTNPPIDYTPLPEEVKKSKRGGRIDAHVEKALKLVGHKASGRDSIRAIHASPKKFDQFDWSKLGHTTKDQLSGTPHEQFAMNLAKIGPWAHSEDISPRLPTKHHAHPVELSGKQANFNSLRSLEKAVRDAGGPEQFRHAMVNAGYGHIAVHDEEFKGTSYVGLKPDTFSVKRDAHKDGGKVRKAIEIAQQYPLKPNSNDRKHAGYSKDGGRMQWMTPDRFLDQSQEMQMDKEDKKSIKKFKKKLKKGRELNPLALYPSGGQDGRHRATAAKELGIKKVPVITWPRQGHAAGGTVVDRALMLTSRKA